MGIRVIRAEQYGGPEVLRVTEAPEPVAGPGQVVAEVAVADVLFVETQIRGGWGREYFSVRPPYVPGMGMAGQVIATGEGVDPGWAGRRVVARTGEQGAYAERVAVPADHLVAVPDGVGLREAAALLNDGATALGLAEGTGFRSGEWVLVTAAGGGLGILLVQLAHAAGARVVGAARGKRKLDVIREMGADAAVDYSEPGWDERVRAITGGAGVGAVFDGAGGEIGRTAFGLTVDGGRFSGHGAPAGGFAVPEGRGVTVRGIEQVQFAPEDSRRLTELALSEAAAGRLRPFIGQTFPLDRAADAHAAIEAREVVGKTLLLV
jgi:NADPH2:quinone reductase